MNSEEQQHYQLAYRLVERKELDKKFKMKLLLFAAVNSGLVYLNFKQNKKVPWSLWTLAGWGLGLVTSYQLDKKSFDRAMRKKEKTAEKIVRQSGK
ncbi:2TM domain-containing protein [Algoriphagus machipongonensis]|uniref:2TM domain-containing protein n=1 Tax=Algoriphagus machipongonensis TaxID=388413 RepID=A3HTI0_9BACT|nr:2TM domain-containing protein [Algoriphagus machipongonensis]EAZ83148.1 hypothetical protein ALPR1_13045 [Algoriphagus machipongonensis]